MKTTTYALSALVALALVACQNTTTMKPPPTLPSVAGSYVGTQSATFVDQATTVEYPIRFVVTQDQATVVVTAVAPGPDNGELVEVARYTGTLAPDGSVTFQDITLTIPNCGAHTIESYNATFRDNEFHWTLSLATELCGPLTLTVKTKRMPN